jgi:hypothetical protein
MGKNEQSDHPKVAALREETGCYLLGWGVMRR